MYDHLRTRERLLALAADHCAAEGISSSALSTQVFGSDRAALRRLRRGEFTLYRIERLERYLLAARARRQSERVLAADFDDVPDFD